MNYQYSTRKLKQKVLCQSYSHLMQNYIEPAYESIEQKMLIFYSAGLTHADKAYSPVHNTILMHIISMCLSVHLFLSLKEYKYIKQHAFGKTLLSVNKIYFEKVFDKELEYIVIGS